MMSSPGDCKCLWAFVWLCIIFIFWSLFCQTTGLVMWCALIVVGYLSCFETFFCSLLFMHIHSLVFLFRQFTLFLSNHFVSLDLDALRQSSSLTSIYTSASAQFSRLSSILGCPLYCGDSFLNSVLVDLLSLWPARES